MWHNHYWGMHFFWWLFWIAMLFVFISFSFSSENDNERQHNGPSALNILQKRYASGELTTEEYKERKQVLEKE